MQTLRIPLMWQKGLTKISQNFHWKHDFLQKLGTLKIQIKVVPFLTLLNVNIFEYVKLWCPITAISPHVLYFFVFSSYNFNKCTNTWTHFVLNSSVIQRSHYLYFDSKLSITAKTLWKGIIKKNKSFSITSGSGHHNLWMAPSRSNFILQHLGH